MTVTEVIYPGELEPCFKADGDKAMSQDHRTHLTVLAKWGSSLAFGGGTDGTLCIRGFHMKWLKCPIPLWTFNIIYKI